MANGLTYTRKTNSAEATKQLAATLAPYLRPGDVVVLDGDLGAGKTQFVQGVAAALGIRAQVTSPTFNVLLEYHDGKLPLYHFDLYRLEYEDQLEDIGYYETTDGDGASFIEWGHRFPEALPYGYLEITISQDEGGTRTVRAHSYGERSRQLLFLWAKDSKSRLMRTTTAESSRI
ncbi:MAG: tRNA (adenosine(37)-N6)-threonylcarbamoyltransferase complex ATPase subunit type 1 TsaE [Eggerthellaceae bacterium]|nr:tRNA (adenosine(37)-N6)-threonylcarbamoyltransferase complex ATPase subunit type 1 TsaE [Eggerthellaceae bacterium]